MARTSYRISKPLYWIMLIGAAFGDFMQFVAQLLWFTVILGVLATAISWFITWMIVLTYGVIFMTHHVSIFKPKTVLVSAATLLIEMTPVVGGFVPSLTFWVQRIVHASRKEDEENAKKTAGKNAKIQQETQKRFLLRRRRQERELVEQSVVQRTQQDFERVQREASERRKEATPPPVQETDWQKVQQDTKRATEEKKQGQDTEQELLREDAGREAQRERDRITLEHARRKQGVAERKKISEDA